MSRGISRGKQKIKFANGGMREIAVDFVYSLKTKRRFKSCKLYGSSFDKINVITACCADIYGHYCIKKSNNDQFHP